MNNALGFPFGFFTNDNTPADAKYYRNFNTTGAKTPYFDVTDATNLLVVGIRYQGLTINIAGAEYWFKNGIASSDLVIKTPDLSSYATTSYVTSALTGYIPLTGTEVLTGNIRTNTTTNILMGSQKGYGQFFTDISGSGSAYLNTKNNTNSKQTNIYTSSNNSICYINLNVNGVSYKEFLITDNLTTVLNGDILKYDIVNRNAAITANPKALVTNEWVTANFIGTGGGGTTFAGLTDVPNSYISQKFKTPRVKEDETGLEYVNVPVTKEILLTSTGSTTFTATHSLNNLYHNITVLDAQINKIIYPEITSGLVSDTLIWSIAPTSGFTFLLTITGLQKSVVISTSSTTSSSYFSNDYSTSDYTA